MPKQSSGLPDWFSLEKYASLRHATLQDWLVELSNRRYTFDVLRRASSGEEVSQYALSRSIEMWERIKQEGTLTRDAQRVPSYPRARGMRAFALPKGLRFGPRKYASIDRTTRGEAIGRLYVAQQINGIWAEIEEARQPKEFAAAEPEAIARELAKSPWNFPLDTVGNADAPAERIVTIDLDAPDDLIMKEFKDWLGSQRDAEATVARRRARSVVGEKKLAEWVEFQVLPYIDLQFAAQQGEWALTQHTLGAVLFPGDFNITLAERIRKSVQRRAAEALTLTLHAALERQLEAHPVAPGKRTPFRPKMSPD